MTLATRVTTPGCGSEWVQTQQVDLAICLHLRSLPQAHYTPLAALRLACLTPAGHPLTAREALTPADLQDYPVITVEVPPSPLHIVQPAQLDAVFGSVRIRVDTAFVACRMVEAGLGVAVADSMTVRRAASASLAQRPLEHPFRAEIGVFTPTYRPRHRAVDDLIQGLIREAA